MGCIASMSNSVQIYSWAHWLNLVRIFCIPAHTNSVFVYSDRTTDWHDKWPSGIAYTFNPRYLGRFGPRRETLLGWPRAHRGSGERSHVREATINLALVKALQISLGKGGKDGPFVAARLLGNIMIYLLEPVFNVRLDALLYAMKCQRLFSIDSPTCRSTILNGPS